MLVVDGRVIEGNGHASRFAAATGVEPGAAIAAAADALGAGTWRLRVDQADGDAGLSISTGAVPRPPVLDGGWGEADMALVVHPGGQGDRKWADRRALQALEARHAPLVPVLCDADGSVLEATWGNVVAIVGGAVCTPPLDGRILAGVTRRALLDEAVDLGLPVRVGRLDGAALADADAVLLTSAVRGLTWVRSIEGRRRFDAPSPLVARLAGALSRRWTPPRPADRAGRLAAPPAT
jgi:hypothetical protein